MSVITGITPCVLTWASCLLASIRNNQVVLGSNLVVGESSFCKTVSSAVVFWKPSVRNT